MFKLFFWNFPWDFFPLLCVQQCAYVQVNINVCCRISNILKNNHQYRIRHHQSNSANTIFLLLDLHFKVNIFGILFELRISYTWWPIGTYYYWHQTGSHIFIIEWHHYKCCTPWPWSTFSRSIYKCWFSETVTASAEMWYDTYSLIFASEWHHSHYPQFLRSKFWQHISKTVRTSITWTIRHL